MQHLLIAQLYQVGEFAPLEVAEEGGFAEHFDDDFALDVEFHGLLVGVIVDHNEISIILALHKMALDHMKLFDGFNELALPLRVYYHVLLVFYDDGSFNDLVEVLVFLIGGEEVFSGFVCFYH